MKYFRVRYCKQTIYTWDNKSRNPLCDVPTRLLNRSLRDARRLRAARSRLLLIINIFLGY